MLPISPEWLVMGEMGRTCCHSRRHRPATFLLRTSLVLHPSAPCSASHSVIVLGKPHPRKFIRRERHYECTSYSPPPVTRNAPLIVSPEKAPPPPAQTDKERAAGPARRERSNSPLPDPPRQPDWYSTAGAWGDPSCSAIVPSSRTCSPRNACCTPSGA
jgi:hypothetical protein